MTTNVATHQNDTAPVDQRRLPQGERRNEPLAGRYGAIGISAVAAAARYSGAAKNPAYARPAPGLLRIDLRFVEAVA